MESRERVFAAIERRRADRLPLYCWLFWLDQFPEIERRSGSVRDFYDVLHLDMIQTFATATPLPVKDSGASEPPSTGEAFDASCGNIFGNVYTLDEAIETPFHDPDDKELYTEIISDIEYHQQRKGRAVFVQTVGVLESSSVILGLQQTLEALALEPAKMVVLFEKIADWMRQYIDNCVQLGVDDVHVSDDFGSNNALLVSPQMFHELIEPSERRITSHIKKYDVYMSLHSDGCIWAVMPTIVDMGFDVVHPVQQSAGMDYRRFQREYGDRLCMYGGLDVRTTLGHDKRDGLRAAIVDLFETFKPAGGGLIFCTSHTPMPHCSVDELIYAYEVAYEQAKY